MVRVASPSDIDAIISIARDAYATPYDWGAIRSWLDVTLTRPHMRCLVGQRSFTIAALSHLPWHSTPVGILLFLTASPTKPGPWLEPLTLLRELLPWFRAHNASTLEAGSNSSYKIEPLLRRLARENPSALERCEHFRMRL